MKIVERIQVLANGSFPLSTEWSIANAEITEAIKLVDWPLGSGKFTVLPERHGNGVTPIKTPCTKRLVELGWTGEGLPPVSGSELRTGDLDAFRLTNLGYIGFEWETGNISSSHRAVNKLLLALQESVLIGAILVVPSDNFYRFLTDRVGNIKELRPYVRLWKSYPIKNGVFEIIVIEYDSTSPDVPRISKGTDGRALR